MWIQDSANVFQYEVKLSSIHHTGSVYLDNSSASGGPGRPPMLLEILNRDHPRHDHRLSTKSSRLSPVLIFPRSRLPLHGPFFLYGPLRKRVRPSVFAPVLQSPSRVIAVWIVVPFDARLCILRVDGRELLLVLEHRSRGLRFGNPQYHPDLVVCLGSYFQAVVFADLFDGFVEYCKGTAAVSW